MACLRLTCVTLACYRVGIGMPRVGLLELACLAFAEQVLSHNPLIALPVVEHLRAVDEEETPVEKFLVDVISTIGLGQHIPDCGCILVQFLQPGFQGPAVMATIQPPVVHQHCITLRVRKSSQNERLTI